MFSNSKIAPIQSVDCTRVVVRQAPACSCAALTFVHNLLFAVLKVGDAARRPKPAELGAENALPDGLLRPGCQVFPPLHRPLAAGAEDDHEHVALARSVRREEPDHLVVKRGRADRAETQRLRREVQLPGKDRSL